jgi:hypothetical protein
VNAEHANGIKIIIRVSDGIREKYKKLKAKYKALKGANKSNGSE